MEPITSPPLWVRPPHDQRDVASGARNETVHQSWNRHASTDWPRSSRHGHRLDVSDKQQHTLDWLTGREDSTLAVIDTLRRALRGRN